MRNTCIDVVNLLTNFPCIGNLKSGLYRLAQFQGWRALHRYFLGAMFNVVEQSGRYMQPHQVETLQSHGDTGLNMFPGYHFHGASKLSNG